MLKAAFSEHEQSVRTELSASARRISDAILAHEQSMSEAMEKNRRSVLRTAGRTWLTILMVSALAADRHEREHSVVAGAADNRQLHASSTAGRYPGENGCPDVGSALSGEQRRPEVSYPAAGDASRSHPLRRPYDGTTWIRLKQE
ncbi:MbeB family mobilization protein [Enterobacter cloacae complex sp. 2DZ2F20B]|uniref:MbeB family mobilization protein n=1 Tax=Enterobacter cloacae complex sp. 2DZ2F20B TaxID=2511993 RepID=UPI0021074A1F|nr:MbeB family mobilization protein [Enterobacter cloacae complex sp. 2DZ2F20B]